ncbi:type II/IV secretion system protein [Planctomycetales bacterium ZRK34]|nr:type II/IV secretion system protein [Planctomycetales bacterium ZRK34]
MTQTGTNNTTAAKPKQLGGLLLAQGLITEQQIEEALTWQREHGNTKLLGEVFIELGYVTADQVTEVLAEAYGVPYAKVTPKIADPRIVEMLPREFIEKHDVLPLFHVQGKLTVALPEPSNVFLIEEIERLVGCPVQIVASTAADIRATLQNHLPSANVFVIDEIVDDVNPDDFSVVERQVTDLSDIEEVAGQSPVVKLVNHLIYSAVHEGASDIHIEPDEGRLRVRYRVDGRMFEKMRPPAAMQAAIVSRIKIMANCDISERRVPQDGGIHVMLDGRPIDLRVSTMPGKFGEKVVIRVIDNTNICVSLEKIGFNPDMLVRFREALHQPHGIMLVTGPTGSGKSTTLYSMLSEINDEDVNVCTVEDPVEYNLMGVNQFQVNEKAGFTFAGALRALLRQDPDIIMVGEIRDVETAKIATQAALTGHQVLSTLHTNDAPSAVTRLINIGVEPFLIAASLRGILAQRLVRKICSHCKQEVEPTALQRKAAAEALGGDIDVFYAGAGCPKCRNTGYSGRLGVFEFLSMSDQVVGLVTEGAGLQKIRAAAAADGFVHLRRDGMEKVQAGLTTVDEVLYATAG